MDEMIMKLYEAKCRKYKKEMLDDKLTDRLLEEAIEDARVQGEVWRSDVR